MMASASAEGRKVGTLGNHRGTSILPAEGLGPRVQDIDLEREESFTLNIYITIYTYMLLYVFL
jgi:hypothetical protein